ncbi:hypothetical protein A5645_08775 [Mycobacterium asiaticum]|nr:hypothetical protein A5645_08775 [Mycobacterium asiaticum]
MSSRTRRPARFAVLTLAAITVLPLAACGSSNKAGPPAPPATSSTSTTAAAPPPEGQSRVSGLIASVSGSAAQVTQQNDQGNTSATVDFTPSTKITDVTPAVLTDVTPGSCVTVLTREAPSGQPATATLVRIRPAADGKCPQPKEPSPGTPARRTAVSGTTTSVAGNTINLSTTDTSGKSTPASVTVTAKTRYTKQNAATSQAITAGKCLTAQGTQGSGGVLQATTIKLRPAVDGKCGPSGGKPHGHGG